MTDKTWKADERAIGKLLGATRLGPTGIAQEDLRSDWLVIEVKRKKELPMWLKDTVAQVRPHADGGHLAIVVIHEHRARYKDSLVVLRLGDWLERFGGER